MRLESANNISQSVWRLAATTDAHIVDRFSSRRSFDLSAAHTFLMNNAARTLLFTAARKLD
jgi:hypothetical protein